jgi:hypothetical protein
MTFAVAFYFENNNNSSSNNRRMRKAAQIAYVIFDLVTVTNELLGSAV